METPSIGFVLYYPFQFYVYKNIYAHLRADAEFIVDLHTMLPRSQRERLLADITHLLDKEGVRYRVLQNEDYYSESYLKHFFAQYKALVSVWERGCMTHPATSHIKKICTTYGAGKELTMVRPSRGVYDLILSYGPRDTKLFSYYTKAEMVGNPKFDDWFNDSVDDAMVSQIKKSIRTDRPTLLYLPTHSDLSSIDAFAPAFEKLRDTYTILAKAHYYTVREEPARMERLRAAGITVFDDDHDILSLLKIADVVLSDNSSAIFDAILADKPTIVADFWDEEYLDRSHKELRHYDRGFQGALTYPDSIEQIIKREGRVITIKKPSELSQKIDEALLDDKRYKEQRALLREELFAFNDGHCADRAVNAIRRLIAQKEPSSRPILHHAIEAYKRHIGLWSYTGQKYKDATLASYKSVLFRDVEAKGLLFSIVVIADLDTDLEIQRRALSSLFMQDFPSSSYEIILISNTGVQLDTVGVPGDSDRYSSPATREVPSAPLLSTSLNDALRIAQGIFICFTSTSCIVPSDWLSQLYLAYKKNPATAGVGSYVYRDREAASLFDHYYYNDIASRLNIIGENPISFRFLFEVTNQLFNTNPAGDLNAMSYRKDVLPPLLPDSNAKEYLGLYSKLQVMREHEITFIPVPVRGIQRRARADWLEQEYSKGLFYRTYKQDIQQVWSYPGLHVVGAITSAIKTAWSMHQPSYLLIALQGLCMQMAGRISAIYQMASLLQRVDTTF